MKRSGVVFCKEDAAKPFQLHEETLFRAGLVVLGKAVTSSL